MEYIEGNFTGCKNLNLHYRCWLPPGTARAILVIVHGLAEHCGRYGNLVNYFVPRGYAVSGFDLQGHGKSEGLRCYVERFSDYINDLDTFINMVRREYKNTRLFLVGHSMGGTIAAAYAVENQQELAGLVVSGMVLKINPQFTPAIITAARVLSAIRAKTGISTLDADSISRDKAVVDAYTSDPLVYRKKISARLGVELLKTMQSLVSQLPRLTLPTLIMHGTADRMSMPEGSRILYERLGSKDKTLKLYEGFYHEIFNEPGYEQVFNDMEVWLDSHEVPK